MTNSDNFGTLKSQKLTGQRKPQEAQIQRFRRPRNFLLLFGNLKSLHMRTIYAIMWTKWAVSSNDDLSHFPLDCLKIEEYF